MTGPLSEFDLIARYFAPHAGEGAFGLTDDAAIIVPRPGFDLVITKDALVERVHFLPEDAPGSIARKALRVNLSDLAAKGASPRGFLLALGRGPMQNDAWVAAFAAALATDAALFDCPLLGGDTVKTSQAFLSVTAFGEVPAGTMVRRQGGNPGDALFVSGQIGDSAVGLQLRMNPDAPWARALPPEHRAFLLDAYLHPRPRLALAPVLRELAHTAMDVSDGLVGDCDKLAAHLGRVVRIADVPLSPAVAAAIALAPELLDVALTGGDDYEILCSVSPECEEEFSTKALHAGIRVAKIGQLLPAGSGNRWLDRDGRQHGFVRRAYAHF